MNRGQLERVEKFLNDFSSEKMKADLDKVFTNRFVEAVTRGVTEVRARLFHRDGNPGRVH